MSKNKKIRILIAKAGLDGHDRGAKIITRALRDAGFEVVYTGLHQTPEMISEAALQEDVDAIGISLLSGAHNFLFPEIIKDLKKKGLDDLVIFGGGIIPDEDIKSLKKCGVKEIFGPGTTTSEMIDWINSNVQPK
jgi:methylmalonyl-CoA mutase C-terminal domain/subunit|tara:strand:- start:2702 stop:3106 length:405 start_codon:yes stop_codon:yes gene_type:complete